MTSPDKTQTTEITKDKDGLLPTHQLNSTAHRLFLEIDRSSSAREAMSLIEGGSQYVTDMDGVKLFRKRK